MANAYKCDRCGEFFDTISSINEGCVLSGEGLLGGTLRESWYPNSLDLCPECANKLREILQSWWKEST